MVTQRKMVVNTRRVWYNKRNGEEARLWKEYHRAPDGASVRGGEVLRPRRGAAAEGGGEAPVAAGGGGLHEHGILQGVEHHRAAEQGFGCKLLYSTIGGSGGGGAELTDEARQIMAAYETYCARLNEYGQALFGELFPFCARENHIDSTRK